MNYCGWFFSIKKKIDDDKTILIYEKRHQNAINDIVHQHKYIYHLTLSSHVNKIMQIGLCPRTENKKLKYPERIYFMLNRLDDFLIQNLAKVFFSYDIAKEPIKSIYRANYTLLKIDTSTLPNNIDFYYYPNLLDAVFTNTNIPPYSISVDTTDIKIK